MKHQTVLILSRQDDEHVARLVPELEALGQQWIRFDPGDFPHRVALCAHLGETATTHLTLPDGEHFALEEISSVWYRRPTPLHAPSQVPAMQQTFIEREGRAGLWGLLRSIEGIWVNHPDAIRASSDKPRQLLLARQLGLSIPHTLITSDPDAFRRFYQECQGQVIYKLLGFPSYQGEDEVTISTYTSLVPEELLDQAYRIQATAHLFQEYQHKRCDLRVVLIGQQFFTIAMYPLSQEAQLDFRRDYRSLRYEVHQLPAAIQQALLEMNRRFGLQYAAVDLLYTEDGRYLYLETNPVGQLGWLEQPTGLPLFRTLARLLAGRG